MHLFYRIPTVYLFTFLILLACQTNDPEVQRVHSAAPITKSDLPASSRVDTSNQVVREIIQLYHHYLHSRPDSIYDNPWWNKKEKQLYHEFDFSRSSMFQGMSANDLIRVYPPFVLSVEPWEQHYQIRVLYSSTFEDPAYKGSQVWCIHKLLAVREDGAWKLANLLPAATSQWHQREVGMINYRYKHPDLFDQALADQARVFCQNILQRFNPDATIDIRFYFTDNLDEMGLLQNFDFYFAGITTGKAIENMIFSAKGSPYYPHELVHQLLPKHQQRGHIIEEGLAQYLGSRIDDPQGYERLLQQLANDVATDPDYTIENILQQNVPWRGYPVAYPVGSAICTLVHQQQGDAGLLALMLADSQDQQSIIESCCAILNTDPASFKAQLKAFLSTF